MTQVCSICFIKHKELRELIEPLPAHTLLFHQCLVLSAASFLSLGCQRQPKTLILCD